MYADTGQHHPAFVNVPTLRDDCVDVYNAYTLLGSARIWNQVGPTPLAMSEVIALLRDGLGIEDHDERLRWLRLIRKLDGVELNYHAEKARTAK